MAGELGNLYTVRSSGAYTTVRTIIQVVASATKPLVVLRMWLTQSTVVTGLQRPVEIVRKSVAGTTTAVTPVKLRVPASTPTAGFTAGHNASVEGTLGDVLNQEGFLTLAGWLWAASPDEQIEVPPAGILAMRWAVAPTTATYRYGMTVAELG